MHHGQRRPDPSPVTDADRRRLLAGLASALLLGGCASGGAQDEVPAYVPRVNPGRLPNGARVGILNLMQNEMTHVNAGTFGAERHTVRAASDLAGFTTQELRKTLLGLTPYQPVPLGATSTLMKDRDRWTGRWNGERFDATLQREFESIIKQNQLAAIIVISHDEVESGVSFGPSLRGSGLLTLDRFGGRKVGVFSSLRFHRIHAAPLRLMTPVAGPDERVVADLPNVQLPDDLDGLHPRYFTPVYEPLRRLIQQKMASVVELMR